MEAQVRASAYLALLAQEEELWTAEYVILARYHLASVWETREALA